MPDAQLLRLLALGNPPSVVERVKADSGYYLRGSGLGLEPISLACSPEIVSSLRDAFVSILRAESPT